jgi:hypothetical protein
MIQLSMLDLPKSLVGVLQNIFHVAYATPNVTVDNIETLWKKKNCSNSKLKKRLKIGYS